MLEPVAEALGRLGVSCHLSDREEELVAGDPRVIVTAHAHYAALREKLPESFIVFTRHGFAQKNVFRQAVEGADFACVSSEWVRDDAIRRGIRPRLDFWVTGFPAMDRVLQGERVPAAALFPPLFPADGPLLLYAPTYNAGLSSAAVLPTDWPARLRSCHRRLRIVIKPHPVIPERQPAWMSAWRQAAERDARIALVENSHASVFDYFPYADLLVSDASSTVFYFLACDKPIVLVANPSRAEERKYFDPEGPEWQWRDCGAEAHSAEDLVESVAEALDHPGRRADRRAFYRERVFGTHTDGRAAERIAGLIHRLLQPGPGDGAWASLAANAHAVLGARDRALAAAGQRWESVLGAKRSLRHFLGESRRWLRGPGRKD
jgi:hypothetical protein